MHRLFVAIRPPAETRRALLALMGGIAGARWQRDDQLHLTLRFIGEVDRHLAEDVAAVLGRVHHPPLALRLETLGQFDRRGHAEALWVGIGPTTALEALHNKINRALETVGIAPETRSYLPHVTLARLNRASGPVGTCLETTALPAHGFAAHDFSLFESRLGHDGASYDEVARFPLG